MSGQLKMLLKTNILALNEVVTFGRGSCRNLANTIDNLEAMVHILEEAEQMESEKNEQALSALEVIDNDCENK